MAWDDTAKTLEVAYKYWHLQSFVDNGATVLGHSMLTEWVHDVSWSHGLDCMKCEVLALIPVVHWLVEIH